MITRPGMPTPRSVNALPAMPAATAGMRGQPPRCPSIPPAHPTHTLNLTVRQSAQGVPDRAWDGASRLYRLLPAQPPKRSTKLTRTLA